MAASIEAYVPFFAAAWFFVAAGYLLYKLRQLPGSHRGLTPVAAYLGGIGLFFVFTGWSTFASTSCSAVDCTDTAGGLVVMLAASFIARFPLQDGWPSLARPVFAGLVVVSVVLTAATALFAPSIQVVAAHGYAFAVAGLFSVGYIVRVGYLDDSPGGVSVGLSMSSCCVGAHGLAALPLVVATSVPLVGVPLQLPVIFAVLSPVSLIAVITYFSRVETDVDSATGTDASA